MKSAIRKLNAQYVAGKMDYAAYIGAASCLLAGLDWQRAIQYRNMLLA